MKKSAIDRANSLFQRRQFGKAILLLENAREIYHESFEYYITLATACLYAGDTGNSSRYFQEARHIKLKDTRLLLGQAAIFLRRGDTDLAVQYYLEVLELDPENKCAKKAMRFIRENGDYETILKWVDSGKIETFYPPIAKNHGSFFRILIPCLAGLAVAFLILHFIKPNSSNIPKRAAIAELNLSSEEKSNLQEKDLSNGVYRYILSEAQIEKSYESARLYFQDYRDNSCRVEINRLLNSNASLAVKAKANLLFSYLEEPTFDTFIEHGEENFSYNQVAMDPLLYIGCWVSWSGRISNARLQEDSYGCDLLVGYENLERVDGIVSVFFSPAPTPAIEGDRAVKILGKIGIEGGKISLYGRAVYQPLRKK
ncbi:tetratricopeptide repeat protein [Treponema pectinovorum]|uniref:tetratricopeptide repeat protein n=1 Tax=Treponema pectinovorum TaxID=164 RepID=UPI0011CA161F|nr:hypothetical protein [Treponema pectinovorum]